MGLFLCVSDSLKELHQKLGAFCRQDAFGGLCFWMQKWSGDTAVATLQVFSSVNQPL